MTASGPQALIAAFFGIEWVGKMIDENLSGHVITWDTAGVSRLSYAAIVAALESNGLPVLCSELHPKATFRRACKDLRKKRVIKQIKNSNAVPGTIAFQFTAEMDLPDGTVNYDYEAKLVLELATGTITCAESAELAAKAQDLFNAEIDARTGSDLTGLVKKLFAKQADMFSINPTKGVAYFVPARYAEFAAKVEAFLQSFGGRLWRFPVPKGTPEGERSAQAAIDEGLKARIDALNSTVVAWDATVKTSTMRKMVDKYELEKVKIEAYRDYLQDKADELKKVVDLASDELRKKIETALDAEELESVG